MDEALTENGGLACVVETNDDDAHLFCAQEPLE